MSEKYEHITDRQLSCIKFIKAKLGISYLGKDNTGSAAMFINTYFHKAKTAEFRQKEEMNRRLDEVFKKGGYIV